MARYTPDMRSNNTQITHHVRPHCLRSRGWTWWTRRDPDPMVDLEARWPKVFART